jgi:UDP-N-acetyl-D-glucosamine dehydrogenase
MDPSAEQLADKFDRHTAQIGIIGLGYVGLPLALSFAEKGFSVLGFDIDPVKIKSLSQGRSYIRHLDAGRLETVIGSGNLSVTTDFGRLSEPDAVLICVPTPLTPQREPDLSFVLGTARQISDALRAGQLVVLESTTYPGTTEELLRPMLEGKGLRCGRDFYLAFSPEREDPGNPNFHTTSIPKVVGGVDRVSGDLAQRLYDQVFARTVRVSSARTAEATKLMENIFRAVNIALVNELKLVYQRMGIDIWEVLDAAATKPFGFTRFDPGPGWGGHCIPCDPFYLAWKAREYGLPTKFIELAGEVNVRMPAHVVERTAAALNRAGKALKGSRILILGLAYKKDIDDPRESPAFEIIDRLLGSEALVCYHDPHIPVAPAMRSWPELPPMSSTALTPELLAAVDAVVLVTDHSAVDYDLVLQHAPLIVDTRGVFRYRPSSKVLMA